MPHLNRIHRIFYFNPRSREGSDVFFSNCGCNKLISIHAPAKGATPEQRGINRSRRNFNPRSREGSDNIHCHLFVSSALFQSTLPRRERQYKDRDCVYVQTFQSTLPRRERRDLPRYDRRDCLISIHAPAKGATCKNMTITPRLYISIHAPAKGATQGVMRL